MPGPGNPIKNQLLAQRRANIWGKTDIPEGLVDLNKTRLPWVPVNFSWCGVYRDVQLGMSASSPLLKG